MGARRSDLFALFCVIFFAALVLVGLTTLNVVTYSECRAHGFSRIYCAFRR
jgi:hypothetical protein